MLGNVLEVLWLSRYDYKPGWSTYMHEHDYCQLIYTLSGDGIFYYENARYEMKAGCNFLIRAGETHSLVNSGTHTLKTLDIKFYLFEQKLLEQLDGMAPHLCMISRETEIYWEKIKAESQTKSVFYKDVVRLNMTLLLLHFFRTVNPEAYMEAQAVPENPPDEKGFMQVFMRFIQQNYQKDLNLDMIANSLGYNKSYLCQIFRNYYDSTPMRFLYDLRIRIAKKLIRTTDYDLKQIAQMTGFKSIHHFSRTFSNIAGVSPGTYRDHERESIRQDILLDESFENKLYLVKGDEESPKNITKT